MKSTVCLVMTLNGFSVGGLHKSNKKYKRNPKSLYFTTQNTNHYLIMAQSRYISEGGLGFEILLCDEQSSGLVIGMSELLLGEHRGLLLHLSENTNKVCVPSILEMTTLPGALMLPNFQTLSACVGVCAES